MRCQYCNEEIKDGLKFCTQCGKKVDQVEVKDARDTETSGSKKAVLGLIVIGLMVVLFMIVYGGQNVSSFKFNSDHIKFLKSIGIDSIGTTYDAADGSKNFAFNGHQTYVYLDKNNGIKAVKFGDDKEVLWDDVYGKKKSLPKKKNSTKERNGTAEGNIKRC